MKSNHVIVVGVALASFVAGWFMSGNQVLTENPQVQAKTIVISYPDQNSPNGLSTHMLHVVDPPESNLGHAPVETWMITLYPGQQLSDRGAIMYYGRPPSP